MRWGVQSNIGVWLTPSQPQPVAVTAAAQQALGWKQVRWREGSRGWLASRFWAGRVRAAHGFHEGRAPGKEVWLLVEWPDQSPEPSKYFLCDLPATSSLRRLVQVAKSRWQIEQNYQQLKEELGLDHYEGRSWNGWHHHLTLVMMAHAFLTLETLRHKKTSGWTLPRTRREIQWLLC